MTRYSIFSKQNILIATLAFISSLGFTPLDASADSIPEGPELVVQQDEFYKARVTQIIGEKFEPQPSGALLLQNVKIAPTEGPEEGASIEVQFEISQESGARRLAVGDKVIIGKTIVGENEVLYYISDIYRLDRLWMLLGIFFVLVGILTRFAGLRAIVSLLLSFSTIVWFIIPGIARGTHIFWVGLCGSIIIACVSLFIAHGFNKRTRVAFSATILSVLISLLLAFFGVDFLHLTGLGSEEAFYLKMGTSQVNLRGILIIGIIIGVLGILDDVTTAQVAAIDEIHEANKSLGIKELYRRGFSVGKEHILSLVNTLTFAYTGSSLPLILLFYVYDRPAWLVANSEIVMEELARILIGSLSLLLAVPIATALAAWYFGRRAK